MLQAFVQATLLPAGKGLEISFRVVFTSSQKPLLISRGRVSVFGSVSLLACH